MAAYANPYPAQNSTLGNTARRNYGSQWIAHAPAYGKIIGGSPGLPSLTRKRRGIHMWHVGG